MVKFQHDVRHRGMGYTESLSAPMPINRQGESFSLVNPTRGRTTGGFFLSTALVHKLSRNIRGSTSVDAAVRAREDRQTHRPMEMENDCALNGAVGLSVTFAVTVLRGCGVKSSIPLVCGGPVQLRLLHVMDDQPHHSGHSGFPFLGFFTDASQRAGSWAVPTFSWGVLLFSLVLSVLLFPVLVFSFGLLSLCRAL